MFTKKIEKLAVFLMKNENNPKIDKEIIVYGLSSAIQHGLSIITTLVIGLLFGLALESIVFLISFSFIRSYAGGYHCEKAINCYLMSSGLIALILAIVRFTASEYMLIASMIILLISVPVILKLAPIGATNKPLDEVEQKYYRKKTIIHLCIECAIIFILFIVELHSFAFIVCLGIMVSAKVVFLQQKLS